MNKAQLLDKICAAMGKNQYHNPYPSAFYYEPKVTRHKINQYLTKLLKERKDMSVNLIDDILNDNIGDFYHYYTDYIVPTCSEYDYVGVNEDGRIYVWCETDGFMAYLDEYKKTWFGTNEYRKLEWFLEAIKHD